MQPFTVTLALSFIGFSLRGLGFNRPEYTGQAGGSKRPLRRTMAHRTLGESRITPPGFQQMAGAAIE